MVKENIASTMRFWLSRVHFKSDIAFPQGIVLNDTRLVFGALTFPHPRTIPTMLQHGYESVFALARAHEQSVGLNLDGQLERATARVIHDILQKIIKFTSFFKVGAPHVVPIHVELVML